MWRIRYNVQNALVPTVIRKWLYDWAWNITDSDCEAWNQWSYESKYYPEDAGTEPQPTWLPSFIINNINPNW